MTALAVDLFRGAGGWEADSDGLDLDVVGVEIDDDACATARAAGLHTVQDSVSRLDPETFRLVFGEPEGVIGSPPCQLFSSAGKGHGRAEALQRELVQGMIAAARGGGRPEMARRRKRIRNLLRLHLRTTMPRARRRAIRTEAERMSHNVTLVWEPARWVHALRPRWVALEQVPPVLPLWQALARALEVEGYRCWTGVLSSERYGVPQTRKRAFMLASLDGTPHPPEPTHQEYVPGEPAREGEASLFGPGLRPWVSMAEALGWGGGRVGFPRRDDTGTSPDGYRERDWRGTDEPAFAMTEKQRSFVREADPEEIAVELRRSDGSGGRRPRLGTVPAPTIRSGEGGGCGTNLEITFRNGTHDHRAERDAGEPAPTLHFGERLNTVTWECRQPNSTKGGTRPEGLARPIDDPARTLDSRVDQWEIVANKQPKAATRRLDEPAPTIKGGHDTADREFRPVAYNSRDQRDSRTGDPKPARKRDADQPAPTIAGESRNDSWDHVDRVQIRRSGDRIEEGFDPHASPAQAVTTRTNRWQGVGEPEADWPEDRPATTVAGDSRVFPPGHKVNDEDVRAGRGGQLRSGAGHTNGSSSTAAVRVSVQEAAVLQSFPPWWPWQGTRTAQFQQIGNAVPPGLARPVLDAARAPTLREVGSRAVTPSIR